MLNTRLGLMDLFAAGETARHSAIDQRAASSENLNGSMIEALTCDVRGIEVALGTFPGEVGAVETLAFVIDVASDAVTAWTELRFGFRHVR